MIEAEGTLATAREVWFDQAELDALLVEIERLPGVDPAGLPVRWSMGGPNLGHGRALGPIRNGCVPVYDVTNENVPPSSRARVASIENVRLCCQGSATRDRIARWMADCVGFGTNSVAPAWLPTRQWGFTGKCSWAGGGYWTLWARKGLVHYSANGQVGTQVPELTGLDPNNDRTLLDGSRWVDAAALAVVARHLGAQGGA